MTDVSEVRASIDLVLRLVRAHQPDMSSTADVHGQQLCTRGHPRRECASQIDREITELWRNHA